MKTINRQESKLRIHKIQLYKSIKEISNILSWDYSIDIVFLLSKEPMRYKQIKKELKLSDNTLSRRLKKLSKYKIIKKLEVSFGTRSGHEYIITELGQELIRFFKNYEMERVSEEEQFLPKRLKYKIVDKRGSIIHHSFNKRNAEKWVRDFGKTKSVKIKRIRSADELRAIHSKKRSRRWQPNVSLNIHLILLSYRV